MTRARKACQGCPMLRQSTTSRKIFTEPAQSAVSVQTTSCQLVLTLKGLLGSPGLVTPREERSGEGKLKDGKRRIRANISSHHHSRIRADQTMLSHHLKVFPKIPKYSVKLGACSSCTLPITSPKRRPAATAKSGFQVPSLRLD